jgi:site-specific DNA-methyltransferase (adenine-specific)
MSFDLYRGNCLNTLQLLDDNSVDSIVTDPPYGLGFMGKRWDYDLPSETIWRECLRVLKPGGHLLAFAGTRTQHRMAVRIEDAGFEIRDMIAWVYGSGFPKSLDVSKALDKAAGAEREVTCGAATAAWQGWGTALKPALEPITVARKPLIGTVAANVLAHGTGALNIDGCRVGWPDGETVERAAPSQLGRWPANLIHDGSDEVLAAFPQAPGQVADVSATAPSPKTSNVYGRLAHEGEPSANSDNLGRVGFKMKPGTRRLDSGSAARFFYCAKASKSDRDAGLEDAPDRILAMSNQAKAQVERGVMHQGEGGMNTAKVRKNNHPTVKPTELMRYLCRLVTPPGGVVLDPFMGSGSTGKAAMLEGFRFIGGEMSPEYLAVAEARIAAALLRDLV